jgi:transposase-like protein
VSPRLPHTLEILCDERVYAAASVWLLPRGSAAVEQGHRLGRRGAQSEQLDGINNVTEQIIGQRVKERYRTMRGCKRKASIKNVSSLIGWIGTQPAGYDLGEAV